jgi:hypothetical protein
MSIHSTILVHWTGKKRIEKEPEPDRPGLYLERLVDYYERGLFAKRTSENVIPDMKMKNIIRLCFTEIRLSQTQVHARRYGRLGLGFARDFVMGRGGRPVIYVPYHGKKGNRLLEDSIRTVYKQSTQNSEVHRAAKWIMAYVKRMSNGKREGSGDDQDYYEEMEWRVVYDERSKGVWTKECGRTYRLRFEPNDVKVVIFPDGKTRQMALEDAILREYFSQHMPVMATLDDCCDF